MRVIFAGGGTGGHINPALSIAGYAAEKDENFEALFIGTRRGLETKLVPAAGYNIEYIDIEGFDRKHILKNIRVLKKLHDSEKRCCRIIEDFRPDCVVCTGGYVSGPVSMAAGKLHIPALIHEQNVYPGLTVSASEKYVDYVAVSFEETVSHMKDKSKCVVTGNPVRGEIISAKKETARLELGITSKKPFVLIFGGSLGADKINETVLDMLPVLAEKKSFRLLFGTGDRNYQKIMEIVHEREIEIGGDIEIVPYINNMHTAMAAADIVVCRSGAITVSELAVMLKPSVLIPSPNVVRNHQEQNAREVESKGGAVVICENELDGKSLYSTITEIVSDSKRLLKMSEGMKAIRKADASERIYELMCKMTEKKQ
ncbi:MAG: undecaprenyldiphospho-muramoylpentapeptide beta-N-acetylglucosaminyltransferase [Clostridia bacterium]|nr:undecaprenyldiphospho-muramoylpentapeptide beta-N-acetylglucosaminyltransferase [Clostridia bacterium]